MLRVVDDTPVHVVLGEEGEGARLDAVGVGPALDEEEALVAPRGTPGVLNDPDGDVEALPVAHERHRVVHLATAATLVDLAAPVVVGKGLVRPVHAHGDRETAAQVLHHQLFGRRRVCSLEDLYHGCLSRLCRDFVEDGEWEVLVPIAYS